MFSWEFVTLDKLGVLKRGVQKHKPQQDISLFENGAIPFVKAQQITKKLFVENVQYYNGIGLRQSILFPNDTVCITNINGVNSSILKSSSCLSRHIHGFISFKNISDSKFVKYCFDFSKIRKELTQLSSIGEANYLTLKNLSKFFFPNPPFELQKKIGQIISIYDLLIANHEKQIDLLKNQRTKLFQRWFVHNKILSHIDIGSTNWKILKLKDVAQISKGKVSASEEKLEGKYPFFTSSIDSPKRTE